MTTELMYLVAATALTSVLWVPYILNRLLSGPGLLHEVGYPTQDTVLAPWAARLKKAHSNAIENLAVFAPLVLVAHGLEISTEVTVMAAALYFWARVAHAAAYTFAIPWLRTLAFTAGFFGQAAFVIVLFGA